MKKIEKKYSLQEVIEMVKTVEAMGGLGHIVLTMNKLTEDKAEKCPACDGKGMIEGVPCGKCTYCNGSGVKGEKKFSIEEWDRAMGGVDKPKPKSLEDVLYKTMEVPYVYSLSLNDIKKLAFAIRTFIKENAPKEVTVFSLWDVGHNAYRKELFEAMGMGE